MYDYWAKEFLDKNEVSLEGVALEQVSEEMRLALKKIPRKDREIIIRDINAFPDGIPTYITFKPGSWCGKQPIKLKQGDEGLIDFLEYVSDSKIKRALAILAVTTAIVSTAIVAGIWIADNSGIVTGGWNLKSELDVAKGVRETADKWIFSAATLDYFSIRRRAPSFLLTMHDINIVAIESTARVLALIGLTTTAITVAATVAVKEALDKGVRRDEDLLEIYISQATEAMADRDGCPASKILTPREIKSLVRHKPKTIMELASLKEFPRNSAKVEIYGDYILEWTNIDLNMLKRAATSVPVNQPSAKRDPLNLCIILDPLDNEVNAV